MNDIQNSIRKSSGLLSVLLLILFIALCAAIALQLAGLIWLGSLGLPGDASLPHAPAPFPFLQEEGGAATAGAAAAGLISAILAQGLLAAMLWLARAIFREVSRDYTPFQPRHVLRLRVISLLLLAMALIPAPLGMLLSLVFSPRSPASASYDFMSLVFVAVFYCVARMFEYGCLLQRQSDETL